MDPLRVLSASEQVAEHLRKAIQLGTWTRLLPGEHQIATTLWIGRDTAKAALKQLEEEGWLESQGAGRRRRIAPGSHPASKRTRTVGFLMYEPSDRKLAHLREAQHQLELRGLRTVIAGKNLVELRFDVRRVAQLVKASGADAWVVVAGARNVLEWFAQERIPTFAASGRWRGLPIAGISPSMPAATTLVTRKLIELGHRRIALLAREERRKPTPGASEQAFLDQLRTAGIPVGSYNLPDWQDSASGLHAALRAMFQLTPPTAIITQEVSVFFAVQQFVGNCGLYVPGDVSLVCTDGDEQFDWCEPAITQIRWDFEIVTRRIVRWGENLARGKADRRQSLFKAKFIEGGTMAGVKKRMKDEG